MTQFVFISFYALALLTFCKTELKCGINENEERCPAVDCDDEHCPKSENYTKSCSRPKECPPPACKCRFNYSRAINGSCISTRDCPEFPCTRLNEEYNPCPPYCPTDDCSQATADGRCPIFGVMLFTVPCSPACRCKLGHWRKKGVCVPYDQCNKE